MEARIAAPLIKQLASRFGEAETVGEVTKVIHQLAAESGAQFAESVGSNRTQTIMGGALSCDFRFHLEA